MNGSVRHHGSMPLLHRFKTAFAIVATLGISLAAMTANAQSVDLATTPPAPASATTPGTTLGTTPAPATTVQPAPQPGTIPPAGVTQPAQPATGFQIQPAAPMSTPAQPQPIPGTVQGQPQAGYPAQPQGYPAQPYAQPPVAPAPGAAPASDGPQIPTVRELFETNIYINGILVALSAIGLILFLYLITALTSGSFVPSRFIDDVTKLVLQGQYEQAIHLCQSNSQVFASSLIQRCIENRDGDHNVVLSLMQSEGKRRAEVIWNRVGYLAEISNIAPSLGLLGTVLGMIKAFFSLELTSAAARAADLSSAIAEAMGTTMFGLIVALMTGFFFTLVKGRATVIFADAEQVCQTVAEHIIRNSGRPADSYAGAGRTGGTGTARATAGEADDQPFRGQSS